VGKWTRYGPMIIEFFVVANLSFLALDIYIAHSANAFSHAAEWIPFYFSLCAPFLFILELGLNWKGYKQHIRAIGFLVGSCSTVVGIAGLLWHLHSNFFEFRTLESLVYTAPFMAPLAYTGLGCLLIMNRMVKQDGLEWSQWLIFFGLAGFFGNFLLALCDHAQNGFFHLTEWIPVISSAAAVSFLGAVLTRKCSCRFFKICLGVMVVQVFFGVLGFYYHGISVTRGQASSFFENIVFAAPVFAPLLFVNLAFLSGLGLLGVRYNLIQRGELTGTVWQKFPAKEV